MKKRWPEILFFASMLLLALAGVLIFMEAIK